MPAPIVVGDTSGLAQGISTAGNAFFQAMQQRAQQEFEQKKLAQQQAMAQQKEQAARQEQAKGLKVMTDWAASYDTTKSPGENLTILQQVLESSGVDPKLVQPLMQKGFQTILSQGAEEYSLNQVIGPKQGPPSPADDQVDLAQPGRLERFSDSELVEMQGSANRRLSKMAEGELQRRKMDRQANEEDRKYHTQFTKKQEEKVEGMRESLPKKKMALRNSRQAVSSGKVGTFSLNNLAEATGIDAFRTARGSQLVTAAKENLLGNLSRVSAKGQNQWFEQRLNSMFPKIGQSMEANLAAQEMLEAETLMDDVYVSKFDELSAEDERRFGYQKKDLDRRARQSVDHLDDLIFERTNYRLKSLAEAEMSSKELRQQVGKKVPKGTPLTLEMAAMFLDKYGSEEKALENAKKLGYQIPNVEDLQLYTMSVQDFERRLKGM